MIYNDSYDWIYSYYYCDYTWGEKIMVSYTLGDLDRIRNSCSNGESMSAKELIETISRIEDNMLN
jgi:hypothetical protein